MSNWGATDADESKPKFLTTAQQKEVYANASGWVVEAGSTMTGNGRTGADPEVLVAMSSLTTNLGAADITQIEWVTTAADKSAGFTLSAIVGFNEEVDVTGTPQLSVTNGNQGSGSGRGPHVLSYASGTGSNELTFSLVIGAANAATNADDVLSFGANPLALNSGTIKDKGTNTTSTITSAAGIGTAAGTITVVA
jgi:hypothetical protein